MLTPIPKTVAAILSDKSKYAIPLNPRAYKWGFEEADDLVEDLKSYQSTTDTQKKKKEEKQTTLFLGNFITEEPKNEIIHIVDGQQRLTTIILLLVACQRRATSLGAHHVASVAQGKIRFTHPTKENISLGCRLIASDSIRDVFEHIVDPKWDGVIPSKIGKVSVVRRASRIRPVYEHFEKHVSGFNQDQLGDFLDALYDAYFFTVEVKSHEQALAIFERTNGRGQDLEISDLLKNYLFQKEVCEIDAAWKTIIANSDGTILRMLKQFYISKNGYILKPQLYKELKRYAEKVHPEKLTQALAEFSKFYRLVKGADAKETKNYFAELGLDEVAKKPDRYKAIWSALQGLREFNVVQFCPVAYAAIECLIRNGAKESEGHAKALVRLFKAFENYHFINNAVCDSVGNVVEKLYADYSKEYAKESSNFFSVTDKLINALKAKSASLEEFKTKFSEISYPDSSSLILYIFDRINNQGLEVGQFTPIYDPTSDVDRHDFTIEHFLAQKFKDKSKSKNEMSYFDMIGNLLPIYFRDNNKLGSATPAEKHDMLTNGGKLEKNVHNLPIIKDFISKHSKDFESWDKAKILKRTEAVASDAYLNVFAIK